MVRFVTVYESPLMIEQEGTRELPGDREDTAACQHISQMLARMSDKWTILVVRTLGRGPLRFNALRREVGEISQKMLSPRCATWKRTDL